MFLWLSILFTVRVGSRSSGREAHLPDFSLSVLLSLVTSIHVPFSIFISDHYLPTYVPTNCVKPSQFNNITSFLFSLFIFSSFFFFFNNLRKFFIQIPFNLPSLHLISPFASTFPPSPPPLYFIRSVCLLTGKKFSIFASRCVHTHRPYANRSLSLILEEHFGSIPPVQRWIF